MQTQGANQEPLCIRDACNKIIHAKVVKYDFAWIEENPIWENGTKIKALRLENNIRPRLLTSKVSTRAEKKWSARVELVPFVLAVSLCDMWKWKLA